MRLFKKMTYKQKFIKYMLFLNYIESTEYEIIEKAEKPIWCNIEDNKYAVYFRKKNMDAEKALLCGHGPTYEKAYKMLFKYYMAVETHSWNEIELIASIVEKN
jgi:hypothetical protein